MYIIKIDLPTSPSYVVRSPSCATWLTGYKTKAKQFKTAGLAAKWAFVHGIQSAIVVLEAAE